MRRFQIVLSLLPVLFVLYGCGKEEGFDENLPAPRGFLRVFNAIPESPDLFPVLEVQNMGSLEYGQSSAYLAIIPDIDRELRVAYSDGENDQILITGDIHVDIDYQTTIVIAGTIAEPQLITIDIPPVDEDASSDNPGIHIVHASNQAPDTIDLFLTTPDEAPATPSAQIGRFQASEQITLLADTEYQIRYGSAASSEILWNSGSFQIDATSRPLFVMIDYFGPGTRSGRIISLTTEGRSLRFPEEQTPGAIRVANMIADVPSVLDFYINDELSHPGLDFQETGEFMEFAPDESINIKVTEADLPENILLELPILLPAGSYQTAAIIGPFDEKRFVISFDTYRRVQDRISLDVSNYSPTLGNMNAYVVPAGDDYTTATPLAVEVGATSSVGMLQVQEYELVITRTGTETIDSGPHPLSMSDGGLYRVSVTDPAGGGSPSVIVPGDDFDPPFDL